MKGNVIVGQSGGPTAAINSSLAGVYRTAKDRRSCESIRYAARYSGPSAGALHRSVRVYHETRLDAELLKRTPAAFLGSCRFKLPEIHQDREVYEKIFGILDKLNIEAFIYIGGNDSMDTIKKLSDYAIVTGHAAPASSAARRPSTTTWRSQTTLRDTEARQNISALP